MKGVKEDIKEKIHNVVCQSNSDYEELDEVYNYIIEIENINQQQKDDIKELELLVGIRQKRNLIAKFDKEYDEEDKKKNPNRDYAETVPDAEEVYKRYYEQKDQLKQRDEVIDEAITFCNYLLENNEVEINNKKYFKHSCDDIITNAILQKLQKYKGDSNEKNR